MADNLHETQEPAVAVSKPDTKNIRTCLKALCISKGLDVKNNDDRIPALLDLLDPKENNEEGPSK